MATGSQNTARKRPEPPRRKRRVAMTDVVLPVKQTDDGYQVIRARPGRVDLAELRPLEDGRPLGGEEIVRLVQREDIPALYDVTTELSVTEATARGRPAQVATAAYRTNWDAAFSSSRPRNKLPN